MENSYIYDKVGTIIIFIGIIKKFYYSNNYKFLFIFHNGISIILIKLIKLKLC